MPDEHYFEWLYAVGRIWREIVAEADAEEGIPRRVAKERAATRLRDLIADGELKVPVDTAILAALDQVDHRDNEQADKILARIVKGEEALDFDGDPALDLVVALGGGTRKPLRHVTEEDLDAMDALKYRNMREAANAYDTWREKVFVPLKPILRRFRNAGDAYDEGAFRADGETLP